MPELVLDLVGTAVGLGAAVAVRRMQRQRWHRQLVRSAPKPKTAGMRRALPLAYSPAAFAAPLALASLARPWGPLSDPIALSFAVLTAAVALLAAGQAAAWWKRRRMRELYPDWLAFLSVALELGIPLASAAAVAAAGLERPLRPVAETLARDLAESAPAAGLQRFASALGTPEAHFVASLLERQRHLGVSVAALLLEEEGLLARARWQERRGRQGVVPYAFTAAVGVLLVNAAVLFLVPRAAALIATFHASVP